MNTINYLLVVGYALSESCPESRPKGCVCEEDNGASYTGKVNHTQDGTDCIYWSDAPSAKYRYLSENYCRNPDESGPKVWCYTSTNGDWSYCSVPECDVNYDVTKCGSESVKMSDYRGTINETAGGIECQSWDSQDPNKHEYGPDSNDYVEYGLESNYCRNPGETANKAWCYTMDSDTRWDYCDVPVCGRTTTSTTTVPARCLEYPSSICSCPGTGGIYYSGTISQTHSGKTCVGWGSAIDYNYLRRNYCRNPDASKQPWCYIDTKGTREKCDVPECGCKNFDNKECGCTDTRQADYRGTISSTKYGDMCQRWDSQTPNQHVYKPDKPQYLDQGLDENYCRNPDGTGEGAWCYLATPTKERWSYCAVDICDPDHVTTTTTTTTTTSHDRAPTSFSVHLAKHSKDSNKFQNYPNGELHSLIGVLKMMNGKHVVVNSRSDTIHVVLYNEYNAVEADFVLNNPVKGPKLEEYLKGHSIRGIADNGDGNLFVATVQSTKPRKSYLTKIFLSNGDYGTSASILLGTDIDYDLSIMTTGDKNIGVWPARVHTNTFVRYGDDLNVLHSYGANPTNAHTDHYQTSVDSAIDEEYNASIWRMRDTLIYYAEFANKKSYRNQAKDVYPFGYPSRFIGYEGMYMTPIPADKSKMMVLYVGEKKGKGCALALKQPVKGDLKPGRDLVYSKNEMRYPTITIVNSNDDFMVSWIENGNLYVLNGNLYDNYTSKKVKISKLPKGEYISNVTNTLLKNGNIKFAATLENGDKKIYITNPKATNFYEEVYGGKTVIVLSRVEDADTNDTHRLTVVGKYKKAFKNISTKKVQLIPQKVATEDYPLVVKLRVTDSAGKYVDQTFTIYQRVSE